MRGAALTWTILTTVVWALHLPPPAAPTFQEPLLPSPRTPRTPQTPAAPPRGPPLAPEGVAGWGAAGVSAGSSPASRIVGEDGREAEEAFRTTTTTTAAADDLHPGNPASAALPPSPIVSTVDSLDGVPAQVKRRSALPVSSASTTTATSASSSLAAKAHRHRHHHAAAPLWLKPHLDALSSARRRSTARHFEDQIAAVFRGVAYGGSTSYRSVPLRRQDTREVQSAPRIERTTAVGDEPLRDYLSDGGGDGDEDVPRNDSSAPPPPPGDGKPGEAAAAAGNTTLPEDDDLLELHEYDPETYDLYEGHYADLGDTRPPEATDGGNASSGVTTQGQVPGEQTGSGTETLPAATTTAAPATVTTTTTTTMSSDPSPTTIPITTTTTSSSTTTTTSSASPQAPRRRAARLSWLDVLRCTHRGQAWVLVNFLLGLLLLLLALLGPYRLLTMRWCTPLLPRTHYVAVHLLVFVAASLKAVYLFHLALGSRGRLPLVLLLLLTNTGFPCLASAFLVLMMMMFVAADVQVYKSRLCTAHNAFVLAVVVLALAFVADVIVGAAHSRSVLLLSRVMVIAVAAAAVLLFIRKQQAVLAVSQMMKREFQGELKLLVLPAKDDSLQRQMGLKHILRSRLGQWCRALRVCAAALALLSLVHLLHAVFLVSSHVPAWAWWLFHVSGCLTEALLALATCVAAALTQRYDEGVSFLYSFMLPPLLTRGKGGTGTTAPAAMAAAGNAEAIYQRVSFSSGTESTHYTSCYPEAALACTPQAPRRRGAPVKRSATFSHAPHGSVAATHVYGSTAAPLHGARVSSTSNLPLYGPSPTRGGVYGSARAPRGSPYGDASVLVHEDGFVRVRTPLDPREAAPRPHGSLIMLQQAHFRGSSPHLRGAAAPEAPSRSDSLYQSLSQRRKSSRGSDVLQNNIDVSEGEYHSSPSRQSYGWQPNQRTTHSPATDEMDHHNLSRRSGRGRHAEGDDPDYHSLSWRRSSHREPRDSRLNNLNRPESDQRSLTRRQVSREDNNDPVHHHHFHHHDTGHYGSRRGSRDARAPPLNVYEEQGALVRPSTLGGSPGLAHKVTNRSFSPASPSTPPSEAPSRSAASPRTPREARFPKPFVRIGSNMSLQGDDLYYYGDYIPRGNPVRRNHSSAGYYPSRYLAPSTPSLVEAQRYGSLRLNKPRKRQPHYMFTPDGKLLSRHAEERARERRTQSPDDPRPCVNGPEGYAEGEEGGAAPLRECPSRQSTSSKKSDEDWAVELIKSSSMLTDFYTLPRDQKKAKKKEKEILEEQEE